jgi:hypothetical protein
MGATLRHSEPSISAPVIDLPQGVRPIQCRSGETSAIQSDQPETAEQASSISVCLSVCVQRAALRTPPPFGRTLSFQTFASRLSGVDSSPEASSGPFPQISSTRLGRGSRRHTLRASMYRIQRTNLNKRS